mmetsp:Transcript_12011/g.50504  ORF Transcript_12011/g.50504 Transcript_12011/m.50504 type:complete len:419 (-) Transcript_12011:120-1376(-)
MRLPRVKDRRPRPRPLRRGTRTRPRPRPRPPWPTRSRLRLPRTTPPPGFGASATGWSAIRAHSLRKSAPPRESDRRGRSNEPTRAPRWRGSVRRSRRTPKGSGGTGSGWSATPSGSCPRFRRRRSARRLRTSARSSPGRGRTNARRTPSSGTPWTGSARRSWTCRRRLRSSKGRSAGSSSRSWTAVRKPKSTAKSTRRRWRRRRRSSSGNDGNCARGRLRKRNAPSADASASGRCARTASASYESAAEPRRRRRRGGPRRPPRRPPPRRPPHPHPHPRAASPPPRLPPRAGYPRFTTPRRAWDPRLHPPILGAGRTRLRTTTAVSSASCPGADAWCTSPTEPSRTYLPLNAGRSPRCTSPTGTSSARIRAVGWSTFTGRLTRGTPRTRAGSRCTTSRRVRRRRTGRTGTRKSCFRTGC